MGEVYASYVAWQPKGSATRKGFGTTELFEQNATLSSRSDN